jgi:diketogulonate reductase-like aldo/keto reductase
MYRNEKEVGQGIRDAGVKREDVFLTTKLEGGQLAPGGVRQSCADSLGLLGTDHVDLLLIHWPEDDVPLADTLGAMAELKQEGKIRHVGVSNFPVASMQEAIRVSDELIFCNQVEYHPYINQAPVLECCRKHDVALVAYSPLARGRVAKDERLSEIGKKHDKSAAQVALRWLMEQGEVLAIPKGSSETHIRENLDIFDFELDTADMAAIHGFEENERLIDPDWGPDWDT